jgi:hypothetical protein
MIKLNGWPSLSENIRRFYRNSSPNIEQKTVFLQNSSAFNSIFIQAYGPRRLYRLDYSSDALAGNLLCSKKKSHKNARGQVAWNIRVEGTILTWSIEMVNL